jgi:uncharacterized lipoprotein YddW (UPF0748 family)
MPSSKLNLLSIAMCCVALISAPGFAQTGSEPGVEQAKQKSDRPLITEFTHPAVETRGVWLPGRDIFLPREQLLAKLDQLKTAGFNRVMISTQFRGGVLYPNSELLPQVADAKGEDLLKLLIDECHARGMSADAWMEYGFYAHFTPDKNDKSMGKWLDADPSLLSVDKNGVGAIARSFGTFYSLDPSLPKARELLARLNVEVATKYNIDSINLDRIRFADWDRLSLEGRARFEKETGMKWAAFEPSSNEGKILSEWKRQQTLATVREITRAVRKARPGLPITSYVVPPEEKDNKSQSWDLWMKEDLLDAVAVSMYGQDIEKSAEEALRLLGDKRGKLVAAVNSEHPTADFLTNIERARQLGMMGQFTWYSGTTDEADCAALAKGPYAEPARDSITRQD